jgi:hypothetical protein
VNHASIEKVLRLHLGPKAPKLGPPLIVAADAYDAVCAEVRARLGAMEEVDFNPDAQRPKKGEAWVLSIHVRDASAHGSWRDHVPLMLWRGPAGELRLAADSWGGQSRGYPLHDYDVLVPIVQAIHTAGEAAALRAKKRDKLLNLKELALRASIDAFAREDGITYGVVRTAHRVRLLVRLSDHWLSPSPSKAAGGRVQASRKAVRPSVESAARWALQARALVNSHASRALERSGAVGVGASPSGDKNSNGLPPSSTIPQHAHSRQNTYFVRSDLPPTRVLRGPSAVHAELAGSAWSVRGRRGRTPVGGGLRALVPSTCTAGSLT